MESYLQRNKIPENRESAKYGKILSAIGYLWGRIHFIHISTGPTKITIYIPDNNKWGNNTA
jgi:hypothetical protein